MNDDDKVYELTEKKHEWPDKRMCEPTENKIVESYFPSHYSRQVQDQKQQKLEKLAKIKRLKSKLEFITSSLDDLEFVPIYYFKLVEKKFFELQELVCYDTEQEVD